MLRKVGIDLKLSDVDLKYLLWKLKNRLREDDRVVTMADYYGGGGFVPG